MATGRTQVAKSIRLDVENAEFLTKQSNQGRYINELIKKEREKYEYTTVKTMNFSFECFCMPEEELRKIRKYYRYVGCDFYNFEDNKIYKRYLYVKLLLCEAESKNLDLKIFDSLPLYICTTDEIY